MEVNNSISTIQRIEGDLIPNKRKSFQFMIGSNPAKAINRTKSEFLLIDTYICSQILTNMKGFFGLVLIMGCQLAAGAQKMSIQQMKTELEKSTNAPLYVKDVL